MRRAPSVDLTEVRDGLHLIPDNMREGMLRWIERGVIPGDFLYAVLTNNLRGAVDNADADNLPLIPVFVIYLVTYAPERCWGSTERVAEWGGRKLLERIEAGVEA